MATQPIRYAQSLAHIHVPQLEALGIRWAAHYAMSLNARLLSVRHHPLHEKSKRRWLSRTDPFWWNVLVSTKIGGTQRVVRGWLIKRARVAFRNALKDRGYAENGARLAKDLGKSAKGDLIGTAQLLVLPPLLHTSWKDLCHQTELIVDAIENVQMQEGVTNRRMRRLKLQL